jgi:hypothetical protein
LLMPLKPQTEQFIETMNRARFGDGEGLVKWLNQHTAASSRISAMLDVLRQALSLARDGKLHGDFSLGDDAPNTCEPLIDRFNEMSSRYTGWEKWTGLFWPQDDRLRKRIVRREGSLRLSASELERVNILPVPIASFVPARKIAAAEWHGYLMLRHLIRKEQIDRVRKCEFCRSWIFVRVPYGDRSQRFCPGGECLRQWRANDPKYKAQQRMHAKEYRKHEKKLQRKAKQQVVKKKR